MIRPLIPREIPVLHTGERFFTPASEAGFIAPLSPHKVASCGSPDDAPAVNSRPPCIHYQIFDAKAYTSVPSTVLLMLAAVSWLDAKLSATEATALDFDYSDVTNVAQPITEVNSDHRTAARYADPLAYMQLNRVLSARSGFESIATKHAAYKTGF